MSTQKGCGPCHRPFACGVVLYSLDRTRITTWRSPCPGIHRSLYRGSSRCIAREVPEPLPLLEHLLPRLLLLLSALSVFLPSLSLESPFPFLLLGLLPVVRLRLIYFVVCITSPVSPDAEPEGFVVAISFGNRLVVWARSARIATHIQRSTFEVFCLRMPLRRPGLAQRDSARLAQRRSRGREGGSQGVRCPRATYGRTVLNCDALGFFW